MTSDIRKAKIKVLHLSDTTLSGAPGRLSSVLNKYSGGLIESRHLVWQTVIHSRVFQYDVDSSKLSKKEVQDWLDWADVIHYHNRYKRQNIFVKHKLSPPKKPSLIQIHSPRESEGFVEEVESGIPLAIIAQYHTRQWPELRFVVPNVVDIFDEYHSPVDRNMVDIPRFGRTLVSYSPSNAICKGWDNKSYSTLSPILKRLEIEGKIVYQRIIGMPHVECLRNKRLADIGIDEVSTGSYHMSSLEYLSMGVACIANIDDLTRENILKITGASSIPWIVSSEKTVRRDLEALLQSKDYVAIGKNSREWMEKYWNPVDISKRFYGLYQSI